MSRVAAFAAGFLASLVCLTAIAQAPAPKPAQAATPPAAQAAPPAPPTESNNQYIIGPGDALQVFVWRNPELTASVPVRPDGKISTPLVENMTAVGKTPSQLARDVEKVLAEYIRSPQVSVIINTPLSTYSQVKVIGQVAKAQSLPYREGMKVLDAVLAVGGLGQFAAGNRAKIVRTEGKKQTEIKVKLADLLDEGDLSQNFDLRSGDVLVVPESRF